MFITAFLCPFFTTTIWTVSGTVSSIVSLGGSEAVAVRHGVVVMFEGEGCDFVLGVGTGGGAELLSVAEIEG